MTARVITVTSGKGGVGKTTTTANLAVALALLGNKVVCIDADIGLRNLDVVMGLENRIVYDIVDVVEGRARLRQAMIKDKRLKEELYMIPAAQTRDKTAVSPSDMVRLCDELRPLVDFIVVDSPAGIERGFRNAVAPADEVLIVTNPEVSSVRDADRIIGLIEAEGKGPGKLIINRVKPDMVKRGDMLSPDDVIDILAIELIGLIPEDEAILVSTNRGHPVAMDWEESMVGRAYRNIARRLMGEKVPYLKLEDDSSWFQKVLRKVGVGSEKSLPPEEPAKATPTRTALDSDRDVLSSLAAADTKKSEPPKAPASASSLQARRAAANAQSADTGAKPDFLARRTTSPAASTAKPAASPPASSPSTPKPAADAKKPASSQPVTAKPDIEIKPPAAGTDNKKPATSEPSSAASKPAAEKDPKTASSPKS